MHATSITPAAARGIRGHAHRALGNHMCFNLLKGDCKNQNDCKWKSGDCLIANDNADSEEPAAVASAPAAASRADAGDSGKLCKQLAKGDCKKSDDCKWKSGKCFDNAKEEDVPAEETEEELPSQPTTADPDPIDQFVEPPLSDGGGKLCKQLAKGDCKKSDDCKWKSGKCFDKAKEEEVPAEETEEEPIPLPPPKYYHQKSQDGSKDCIFDALYPSRFESKGLMYDSY